MLREWVISFFYFIVVRILSRLIQNSWQTIYVCVERFSLSLHLLSAHSVLILIINDILIELIEMRNIFRHFTHAHWFANAWDADCHKTSEDISTLSPAKKRDFNIQYYEKKRTRMRTNYYKYQRWWNGFEIIIQQRLSIDFIHIHRLLNVQKLSTRRFSRDRSAFFSSSFTLTYVKSRFWFSFFVKTFIHSFLIPVQISDDTFMPFVRLLNWKWKKRKMRQNTRKNCATNYAFA